jgi:hypothetical protein
LKASAVSIERTGQPSQFAAPVQDLPAGIYVEKEGFAGEAWRTKNAQQRH